MGVLNDFVGFYNGQRLTRENTSIVIGFAESFDGGQITSRALTVITGVATVNIDRCSNIEGVM